MRHIHDAHHEKTDLKVFVGVFGRAHPSFGMTPTFREYDLLSQKTQILKSRCHTKRSRGAKDSNSKTSLSDQKKDGRGLARPSFFWYDTDKDLKVCFLVTCVMYVSHVLQDQPCPARPQSIA